MLCRSGRRRRPPYDDARDKTMISAVASSQTNADGGDRRGVVRGLVSILHIIIYFSGGKVWRMLVIGRDARRADDAAGRNWWNDQGRSVCARASWQKIWNRESKKLGLKQEMIITKEARRTRIDIKCVVWAATRKCERVGGRQRPKEIGVCLCVSVVLINKENQNKKSRIMNCKGRASERVDWGRAE